METTNEGSRGGRAKSNRGRRRGGRGDRQGKGGDESNNDAPDVEAAKRNKNVVAPLTAAVASLSLDAVNAFLSENASLIDRLDHKGETALTTVCGLRKVHSTKIHTDIVEALFAHGAQLSVKNQQGRAAFTLACYRRHVHLLPLLLREAVAQEQINPYETLPQLLFATLGGLDNRNNPSDHATWDAAQQDPEKYLQTVQFLIEQTKALANGNVFIRHACQSVNSRGLTPLHLAAGLCQPKTVQFLLENYVEAHEHEDNTLSMTPIRYLDLCFSQVEGFITEAAEHSDARSGDVRRGRGKKQGGRNQVMSKIGIETQQRAVDTLLVLGQHCGMEPLFMSHGCFAIRSRRLKNALVAHLGLASILEKTCDSRENMGDSKLVILDYVGGLYRALHKNSDLLPFWNEAINPQDSNLGDLRPFTASSMDWMVSGLISQNQNPRFVSTWVYIISDVLKLYAPDAPTNTCSTPTWPKFLSTDFYLSITTSIARTAKRLLFNLCESDTTDDEFETKVLFAKFEMFLLWFVPHAFMISEDASGVFQTVIAPLQDLWSLTNMALQVLSEEVYSPDRFAVILHLLQLLSQLQTCFETGQTQQLYKLLKAQANKPHVQTWKKSDQVMVPIALKLIASKFDLPSTFVEWMKPLRTQVNVLIRSEVRLLQEHFHEWISHPSFITTENKMEYLEAVADDRQGNFHLTINRQISSVFFLDFIIQQVLCTPGRNLTGEMEITFLNEPGLGVGPLREFFELVSRHFFNPNFRVPSEETDETLPSSDATKSIGSQWLKLARKNSSIQETNTSSDAPSATKNLSASLWLPLFSFTDASQSMLGMQNPPLSVSTAPEDHDGVLHVRFDQLVENVELGKVYRCLGRLMGLALRHQAPLGVLFPLAFWKVVFGERVTWEDYTAHNPDYQKSLRMILDHDFDADPTLEMYFETCGSITVSESNSKIYTAEIELELNGKTKRVTNANKKRFVDLSAARYFCNSMPLLNAFQKGVLDVIYKKDLKWFSPEELQSVVQGPVTIDLKALQKHVHYTRPAHSQHPTIAHFWAVVEEIDESTLRRLLLFWSGSSLPPLFGFDSLGSNWSIKLMSRDDSTQWPCPQAVTCEFQLLLPQYPSREILKEKLLVALTYGSFGFDRV
ncbi:unnamed protein product [Aphanomyces euteiches]